MGLKILFATDTHVRVMKPVSRTDPDYLETICNKLQFVCELSKKADLTILGGDIFDAPNCPNSAVIRVMRIFSECGSFIHTIVGQHDIWGYAEKSLQSSALGVLIESGCIRKLDNMDMNGVHIQAIHAYDKLHGTPSATAKLNILVAHKLISDKSLPSGIAISDFHKVNQHGIVLSGDMHEPHSVTLDGKLYLNPGSLARQSISDRFRTPQVAMITIDDDYTFSHELIDIPSLPGESVFNIAAYKDGKIADAKTEDFVKGYANTVMSVKSESFKVGEALVNFMRQGNVPEAVQETVKTYYSNAESEIVKEGI